MDWLLRLRAWQLFLAMVALPLFICYIITTILSGTFDTASTYSLANAKEKEILKFFWLASTFVLILHSIQSIWQYQIGTTLARKLPESRNSPLLGFKLAVFLLPMAILLAVVYVLLQPSPIVAYGPPTVSMDDPILTLITICMLCWAIGFCFKYYHLVSVLNQIRHPRIPYGSRSEINLFLLACWPFGLWVLQPRIKAFYEGTIGNQTIDHMVD
jgi:hypothetical protein